MQRSDVSGFPIAFLTCFFANLNQSRGRVSIDMNYVRRSDRPLPREELSPYSIGRVDGGFRKSRISNLELDGVVLVLEARPWKTSMGHARVFDAGVGEWTNEQMREKKVDSARLVLLIIPSSVGRDGYI